MDWVKIHLAVNHIAVIGLPFLLILLGYGLIRKIGLITRLSIAWIAIFSVVAIALKFTGDFAAESAGGKFDPVRATVNRHEQAADQATTAVFVLGLAAALACFLGRKSRPIPPWCLVLVVISGLFASILLARTANLGGQISHPELRASPN